MSSKTYRKAVSLLAKKFHVSPRAWHKPSDDSVDVIEQVLTRMYDKALKWYRRECSARVLQASGRVTPRRVRDPGAEPLK
jgi:hypothetical protein